jgi:sugar lactone lactonase YvrE
MRVDSGYVVANGPAFSPCGRWLYHTDTGRGVIYRFELVEEGVANRQPFVTFGEGDGSPDGMTVDVEGGLWVAHWGGGRVSRFSPEGKLDREIALPARQVTNVAFAGEKLDRLFATSAATGLPPSEHDGALFEIETGTRGLAAGLYAG